MDEEFNNDLPGRKLPHLSPLFALRLFLFSLWREMLEVVVDQLLPDFPSLHICISSRNYAYLADWAVLPRTDTRC